MKNIDEIYSDYMEYSNDMAPEQVREASKKYSCSLDEYIAAVSEFSWKNGYSYALSMMKEGARS